MGGSDLAPSIEKVPLIMIACPKIEICVRKPYTNWGSVCLQESCFLLESEFLESKFQKSIFRCLAVLWKMNWKTLSSVCLCYEK
jgi:hypothetical protein